MFFKRPLFFSFSFFFVIFVEFSSLLCSTYAFVVIFVYVILIRHMTKILVKWFFLLRWKILENRSWKIQSCMKRMSLN
jgi:hypothetical protein